MRGRWSCISQKWIYSPLSHVVSESHVSLPGYHMCGGVAGAWSSLLGESKWACFPVPEAFQENSACSFFPYKNTNYKTRWSARCSSLEGARGNSPTHRGSPPIPGLLGDWVGLPIPQEGGYFLLTYEGKYLQRIHCNTGFQMVCNLLNVLFTAGPIPLEQDLLHSGSQ